MMDSTTTGGKTPSGVNAYRHSPKDRDAYQQVSKAWSESEINDLDKLEAFARFSTKRSIARFLVKTEIFKRILNINGSIVECGVFNGAGLFSWAALSEIYEPVNHTRKITGFDTFGGFPSVTNEDNLSNYKSKKGDLRGDTLDALKQSVLKHNLERNLGHIEKVELIKGDFMETGGGWLSSNPHVLISLLYLDFDLYEPTMEALKLFIPRMHGGSIIAFDELNCGNFPGETLAYLETLRDKNLMLERSPIDPWISWVTL
jgi:hypothetical protein